jgi:NAD(P)-dependent dehydrogenase (short-subunit alcohol dehydrogenase family)
MTTSEKARTNRFVVITGANTGIGRATAEELGRRGHTVVLAGRSAERTQPVLAAIRGAGGEGHFIELDLGELASVRAGAARILELGRPIDILINNAGLAGQRGLTKDGFELTFGTNHLGHFLLTVLLAPSLKSAAPSRIVNVASQSHYQAKGIDFTALQKPTRTVTGMPEYAVSKLANVLFTSELARRLGPAGVHSYALHPGVVASDIWRRIPWGLRSLAKLFMITNEEGAKTSLYCATSPEVAEHNGRYYDKCREKKPSRLSGDAELARQLWEKSVQWVGADL